MSGRRRLTWGLGVLLGLALSLTACGGAAGGVTVSDAWVRSAPSVDRPSAAYFTLTNSGGADDRLLGVITAAAQMAQMHQTVTQNNVMSMAPIESIVVPAHGQVAFAPGGNHVMLMGLTAPLKPGDTVTLKLKFEKAGIVTVTAEVKD